MNRKEWNIQLAIVFIASVLFIPFLGKVHLFDWDEINFAESAREMIVTGDYLNVRIYFEPFWEKPPLFIWFQVLSFKLFGVTEFAARFPNALCGIVTLSFLFHFGRKLYNNQFGILWALAYCGSILPFFYFKSGIIDPWFNLFIFLGIVCWVYAVESEVSRKKMFNVILSAICIGLAVLTKGPVSILVFGLVIFILFLFNGFRIGLNWKQISVFTVTLCLIGGFWFILMLLSGKQDLIRDFISYQIRLFSTKDAGHGGFPLYHFVILLFGVFPASVLAIKGHKYIGKRDINKVLHIAMISLLWIVLLLFSIVKTKIVHYSSLTYFPITFLAAYAAYHILNGSVKYNKWIKIIMLIVGTVPGLLITAIPFIINNKNYFIDKGIITHSFTIGNLQADPGWNTAHAFIGLFFLIGLIAFTFFFNQRKNLKIYGLFATTIMFIYLSVTFFVPGGEQISQNAAIEFIKEKSAKDAYIRSFYKSYAILFYGKQMPGHHPKQFDIPWLTSSDIDKDAYFVMRIDKKDEVLTRYPRIDVLYEKNGYVFAVNRANNIE